MKAFKGKKRYLALLGLSAIALAATSLKFEDVVKILENRNILTMHANPTLEKIEKNELANILGAAKIMFQVQLLVDSLNPSGGATRDAHAKGHGCAIADFEIANDIPAKYQTGLFKHPGRNHEALIRYSNGSGRKAADIVPDGRGMAVKVLEANRGNILDDGNTQDFMMINFDRFFIGKMADYIVLQELILKERDKAVGSFFVYRSIREALAEAGLANAEDITKENIYAIMSQLSLLATGDIPGFVKVISEQAATDQAGLVLQSLGKKLGSLKTPTAQLSPALFANLPLEAQIAFGLLRSELPSETREAFKLPSGPVESSLNESYFSMSSYLYKMKKKVSFVKGNEMLATVDTAVKYISRPVSCADGSFLTNSKTALVDKSDTFLKEDLAVRLSAEDQCYNFYILPLSEKLTTAEKQKLVEDPRLQFKDSSEILVAHIRMKSEDNQGIASDEQQKACENLSFNPWHAGSEHQPLGAMNRGRKVAVTASSIRRHFFNKRQSKEPKTIKEYLQSVK